MARHYSLLTERLTGQPCMVPERTPVRHVAGIERTRHALMVAAWNRAEGQRLMRIADDVALLFAPTVGEH